MSCQIKEDWDLCRYFQSDNGCKNSKCVWRHEKLSNKLTQNQYPNTGNSPRRDQSKKSNVQFYTGKTQTNGRIEIPCQLKSEYCRHGSSSMSESSPGRTTDCQSDVLKNVFGVLTDELTEKANDNDFLQNIPSQLQKSRRQLKNKDDAKEFTLSPFAKVFVPSQQTSKENKIAAVKIADTNRSMTTAQQLPNLNTGSSLIGKVYE